MANGPELGGSTGFNVVTKALKFFGIWGGKLSESEDGRLSESVKLRGLEGDVVTSVDALRTGRYLDCGCLARTPEAIAGECRYPGCGALICKEHAGACEAEGLLMCRTHLCDVAAAGERRRYCVRCAWARAPLQMLLGPTKDAER